MKRIFSILSHLPWGVMYGISNVLYVLVYYLVGYRRGVVRANLEKSFPEKEDSERRGIEKAFYRHFCDMLVETVKLFSMPEDEIRRRMEFPPCPEVERWYAEGRSVLGLMGHMGNWEYIPSYTLHVPRHVHVIQLYKQLYNPGFDRLMHDLRERFGSESVEARKGYHTIAGYIGAGQQVAVGFLADQAVDRAKFSLDFMHRTAPVYEGAERIGRHFHCAILYFDIEKTSRGHYRVHTIPLTADASAEEEHTLTTRYIRLLEASIRRQPELYLWSHRRWKYAQS